MRPLWAASVTGFQFEMPAELPIGRRRSLREAIPSVILIVLRLDN